jgi:hypothetical protein
MAALKPRIQQQHNMRTHSSFGSSERVARGFQPPEPRRLLLPGAFLMTMGAQLLAPFMFIDFGFPTFF